MARATKKEVGYGFKSDRKRGVGTITFPLAEEGETNKNGSKLFGTSHGWQTVMDATTGEDGIGLNFNLVKAERTAKKPK